MASETPQKPKFVQRLEAQRDRHRERSFAVRALYVLVGFTLLGAGVAMLLLPGPAFVVIPIGLALLSLEFAWAENLLDTALQKGEIAKRKAAQTSRTQRIFTIVAVVLGSSALLVWALTSDIPLVPV